MSYKGDLILALKYVPADVICQNFSKKPSNPAKGALEVLVTEARNLMATRSNGTSDPFCKRYINICSETCLSWILIWLYFV